MSSQPCSPVTTLKSGMTTLSLLLSADVLAERGPLRLIPTTEDAKRYSLKLDPKVTIPLQERTYTSPIWYIS